jgi:hypothetical protein
MTKKVLSLAAAALVLVAMSMPLHAVTASANEAAPVFHYKVGDVDMGQPVKGQLDRTTQFDVVPGEEFTFDMVLRNTANEVLTANVLLRLVLPNSDQRVFMNEDITFNEHEVVENSFAQYIPDNLRLYGRYTMQLFINNVIASDFQFDVNSRADIVVRWDDGVMANAYAWYDAGNKWAIRGCMPNGAVIDEIGCYILSENDIYWPWPDSEHQAIQLAVYNDDGGGGFPGTELYNSGDIYVNPANSEATAFPGIGYPGGAFFVSNIQLTPYPTAEAQGVDAAVDHGDQLWAEIAGVWQNYYSVTGDYMIWAIGHVGSQRVTIGNPPAE